MEINTESINTSVVMERYGIKSRTTLNDWLERAGITSFKEGKQTFIHAYQLDALDAIAREMGRKVNYSVGTPATDFIQPVVREEKEITSIPEQNFDITGLVKEFELLPSLAKWYASYLILEHLALKQVIIPRDILLIILGKKKLPSCKEGNFRYGNFMFIATDEDKREWFVVKDR